MRISKATPVFKENTEEGEPADRKEWVGIWEQKQEANIVEYFQVKERFIVFNLT